MVFQEESATSWLWPLSLRATSKEVKDLKNSSSDDENWDCERAFEIADRLEQGLAREIVTDFMHPLRRSSKLWRFRVVRSEDKQQFRLFSDEGDFLMFAQACHDQRLVNFFSYNPSDQDVALFNPARPAFTMTYNKAKTEWRLVQERCENCQFSPKHMSCACSGKQQVAFMRHHRRPIGEGIFNCMEVHVPGLYADESRVIWCPKLGRGDLSEPLDNSYQALQLSTKQPVWNDEVESLVLDFKGRNVLSSAKNFQLSPNHKPDHVVCQYGKIGVNTFSLDFRYPLSVIQAFGTALTTMFWA
mmetsp:Transcript_22579/g.40904  ORF Transcript_22579/g.40904 Transcript_22579/m.40904 type:complete len:301 (-) Transcript_22579:489-1391(-)